MVPELYPIISRLLISREDHENATYPTETSASELVGETFLPRAPWDDLVAVTPMNVAMGTVGRQQIRFEYQRFVFGVSIPYDGRWPDVLLGETKDVPFAILQKRTVLMAHIFMGSVVGINVEFKDDKWEGQIGVDATRVKRLLDMVV